MASLATSVEIARSTGWAFWCSAPCGSCSPSACVRRLRTIRGLLIVRDKRARSRPAAPVSEPTLMLPGDNEEREARGQACCNGLCST
jgi:hypothetical protein